jgi:hypothetical protein
MRITINYSYRALALILLLFGPITPCTSQGTKLNQIDSTGKKDGKWVIYLNKNWKEVKDSNKAFFYSYTYYRKDKNIHPMGHCGKNWKVVQSEGSNSQTVRIKLLNGEYTWKDYKDKTRCIAVFSNGECLSFKWFYSNGLPQSTWDYTKKYKEQAYSYWFAVYNKKGTAKEYYYRRNCQETSEWYCFPTAND